MLHVCSSQGLNKKANKIPSCSSKHGNLNTKENERRLAALKVHPKPDLRQGTSAYSKTSFLFHLITDRLVFVGSNLGMDWSIS